MAAIQASQLLATIKPATFAEIQVEPRLGWLPVSTVEAWVNDVTRARGVCARAQRAFLTWRAWTTSTSRTTPTQCGWSRLPESRHGVLRPRSAAPRAWKTNGASWRRNTKDHFVTWIEGQAEHQAAVTEAHNRTFRGWVTPEYSPDPLVIARWNPEYPLWPYQNSAVRRPVENRGGGCFFDVGLGKTRTLLGRSRWPSSRAGPSGGGRCAEQPGL